MSKGKENSLVTDGPLDGAVTSHGLGASHHTEGSEVTKARALAGRSVAPDGVGQKAAVAGVQLLATAIRMQHMQHMREKEKRAAFY